MKIKTLLFGFIAAALVSCGGSKAVAPTVAVADEVEISVPCSGIEFTTSTEYFRANASGLSTNMEQSTSKAMLTAQSRLAASINTLIKSVTDSYTSSYEENDNEEFRSRFQNITRGVVNEQLKGTRTICTKTMKTSDGKYRTYLAIELAGADIAKGIAEKVNADSKLRTDFEYSKYEDIFNKEMAEYPNKAN